MSTEDALRNERERIAEQIRALHTEPISSGRAFHPTLGVRLDAVLVALGVEDNQPGTTNAQ